MTPSPFALERLYLARATGRHLIASNDPKGYPMLSYYRLFKFYRRSGATFWNAASRACETMRRTSGNVRGIK